MASRSATSPIIRMPRLEDIRGRKQCVHAKRNPTPPNYVAVVSQGSQQVSTLDAVRGNLAERGGLKPPLLRGR